jgi:2-C-methyl-D-erythritol 2,4-cyclodiphosphate synthase
MFRIGNGFDVHRLVEGRKLILCGVEIPYEKGLLGHSDADVALHALADALLGAAALRDIGYHFPDSDPKYKGADSRILLRETLRIIREQRNLHPVNVDVTIIAQAPKLLPYIPQMIANVAADLNLPLDCVSVKATTTERLGYTGRGEGIAAQATALLTSRKYPN